MTDHQYIQLIKKSHARRRLTGVIGLLIILLVAVGCYFGFVGLDRGADNLLEAGMLLNEGDEVTQAHISNVELLLDTAQSLGTENGIFVGRFMSLAVVFGIGCLIQIFGGRKDRLLLACYEGSTSDQTSHPAVKSGG